MLFKLFIIWLYGLNVQIRKPNNNRKCYHFEVVNSTFLFLYQQYFRNVEFNRIEIIGVTNHFLLVVYRFHFNNLLVSPIQVISDYVPSPLIP